MSSSPAGRLLPRPLFLPREETECLPARGERSRRPLLLLSQQEERHLLEGDLNKALEKKLEELQRNLSQVGFSDASTVLLITTSQDFYLPCFKENGIDFF
ncbi:hypothetical protein GW17_00038990 [Ensete ventricosum]|nr:hypothetical protein GW17_00038990 [Ensete ventricosum]